jgi:hypothetical protein
MAAVAMALVPSSPQNNLPLEDDRVLVFRYHPGLLAPNMEARLRDDERILQTLSDREISHSADGGLGRGYEVKIWKKDLGRWKDAINSMIENKVLEVYRWGTDMRGYGLLPIE